MASRERVRRRSGRPEDPPPWRRRRPACSAGSAPDPPQRDQRAVDLDLVPLCHPPGGRAPRPHRSPSPAARRSAPHRPACSPRRRARTFWAALRRPVFGHASRRRGGARCSSSSTTSPPGTKSPAGNEPRSSSPVAPGTATSSRRNRRLSRAGIAADLRDLPRIWSVRITPSTLTPRMALAWAATPVAQAHDRERLGAAADRRADCPRGRTVRRRRRDRVALIAVSPGDPHGTNPGLRLRRWRRAGRRDLRHRRPRSRGLPKRVRWDPALRPP